MTKKKYNSGWKLESWFLRNNWVLLSNPSCDNIKMDVGLFLKFILNNEIKNGEIIGRFYWDGYNFIKEPKNKQLYNIVHKNQKVTVIFQKEWEDWYIPGEFTVGESYAGVIRHVEEDDFVIVNFQNNFGKLTGEIEININDNFEFIKI